MHVPDMLADPGYAHELALAGNWRATLAVPMLCDGKPVGAISVGKAEAVPFSERQMQLLSTFADQAVIAIENVRLFNETQEALEQQTATSEVLKVISSSPGELEPVFNALLANAIRICEAGFGNLFLREGSIFRSVAIHSKKGHADFWRRRNPVVDVRDNPGIPLDRVTKTKQVVHIPDLRTDQSYLGQNDRIVTLVDVAGARTLMSVPMLKEDELIGAIVMYRQEVRPFTDKQIELVQNFAAQAVIAIENARLLNELRESLEQQTATADILAIISSSQAELKPVFETIVDRTTRICGATFACLGLFEGSALRFAAISGTSADFQFFHPERLHQPDGCPYVIPLARAKSTLQTEDLRAERGYVERDPFYVIAADVGGARTVLRVPLLKDNILLGHLWAFRQEVRLFSGKQIELVKNFAAQAVIAIENTRLLNELRSAQRDLSEALQQQTGTAEVLTRYFKFARRVAPVFGTMLEKAVRICDASYGMLFRAERWCRTRGCNVTACRRHLSSIWQRGPQSTRSADRARPRHRRPKATVHIVDVTTEPAYVDGEPVYVAAVDLGRFRTIVSSADAQGKRAHRRDCHLPQEVRPFTDKQIELVNELCRASCHRHREHAAAQRTA